MHIRAKHYLAGVAVVFLALPLWSHTESAQVDIDHPVTISGTQLQPGQYELRVKDYANQAVVTKDGNVVAQVPCHWIQLPKEPQYSQVMFTKNQITEVDFGGKTQAVEFR